MVQELGRSTALLTTFHVLFIVPWRCSSTPLHMFILPYRVPIITILLMFQGCWRKMDFFFFTVRDYWVFKMGGLCLWPMSAFLTELKCANNVLGILTTGKPLSFSVLLCSHDFICRIIWVLLSYHLCVFKAPFQRCEHWALFDSWMVNYKMFWLFSVHNECFTYFVNDQW